MMCNMYRGAKGAGRSATTYCDAYHVVPSLVDIVDPGISGDEQLRALDRRLPWSVLPCALALACRACQARWPEASRSQGSIFGPGAPMPDWLLGVRCGAARFRSREVRVDDLLSAPGTTLLGTLESRQAWIEAAPLDTTALMLACLAIDDTWVVRGEVNNYSVCVCLSSVPF